MNPAFSSLLAALARELDLPGIETRDGDSSCLLGIDDFEVSLRCLSTDQVMIFTVVAPLPRANVMSCMPRCWTPTPSSTRPRASPWPPARIRA